MGISWQSLWRFLISRLGYTVDWGANHGARDDALQLSFVPEDVWNLPADPDSV